MMKKKTFLKPTFRNSSRIIATLFITAIFSLCFHDSVFAFKPKHHRTLTRVLQELGFDNYRVSLMQSANVDVDYFDFLTDAAHCDYNKLTETSGRVKKKIDDIIEALKVCNRFDATRTLGNALHTVQDIYAHTNAVDDNIIIKDILDMKTTEETSCRTSNPRVLVSGYFNPFGYVTPLLDECYLKPDYMCCHLYLNKDDNDKNVVPNWALFDEAMIDAEFATLDFIETLRKKIEEQYPDNEDYYMNMLKKSQRIMIFVIDTTGSMSNDIAGVKTTVNVILDRLVGESPTLGLVTFKDNVTGSKLFCDIEKFREAINDLVASGGDDCPEASNRAMLTAIDLISGYLNPMITSGAKITLATDASAGDSYLGPLVRSYANARGVSINTILTGDCVSTSSRDNDGNMSVVSSYTPSKDEDPLTSGSARVQLAALANETGGTLFWVNRSEVDEVTNTLMEMGEIDNTILFQNKADCEAGKPVEFEIPVDTTLNEKITFMVTQPPVGTLSAITLKRPGGDVVSPDDTDATYLNLSSVKSYTIQNPAAGLWKLQIEGNGELKARAYGNSPFTVNEVRFLKQVDPVYPGVDLIPIDGDPAAGSNLVLDIHLSGPPASLNGTLERQNGDLLQTLSLVSIEGQQDFRSEFTVPDETFIINLSGETEDGSQFARTLPIAIIPQLVSVEVDTKMVTIPVGDSTPVNFKVHNVSDESVTYSATISSSLDWPNISIPDFKIEGNGTAEFNIDIPVPEYEEEDVVNDIVFIVQDINQASVRNSATLRVTTALKDTGPYIAVTNPTDGSTVSGTVTIEADAEDDKGIKSVDFYIDNVLKHTDKDEPYTCDWDTSTYTYGSHTIKVKAIDTSDQTAVDNITVNVDNPPTVVVTTPQNGAIVFGTIDIQAEASDDGGIAKVEFYIDGTLINTDTTAPYTSTWTTLTYQNGAHKIKAIGYDTSAQQTSYEIDVTVQNVVLTLQAERLEERAWIVRKYLGRIHLTAENTGNVPIQKYTLYRKQTGGIYQSISEIEPSQLQNGSLVYLDKYLDKDTNYTYKLVAYDPDGKSVGVSNEQTI